MQLPCERWALPHRHSTLHFRLCLPAKLRRRSLRKILTWSVMHSLAALRAARPPSDKRAPKLLTTRRVGLVDRCCICSLVHAHAVESDRYRLVIGVPVG
jgi:hypothetical protein